MTTFGPTSSLGEITFEGTPPDLINLDDFESNPEENENSNSGQGAKLERYIHRKILSRFTDASVIVLGIFSHADSLIDRLLNPNQSSIWTQRFYPAVGAYPTNFDLWFKWAEYLQTNRAQAQHYFEEYRQILLEGVEVLWPEKESFMQMMSLRALYGWEWFDRHRQCAPLGGCWRISSPNGAVIQSWNDSLKKPYILDHAGYRREWGHHSTGIDPTITLVIQDESPPECRIVPVSQIVKDGRTAF